VDCIVIVDPFSSSEYIYHQLKSTGLYIVVFIYNDNYVNIDRILAYDYDQFEYINNLEDGYKKISELQKSQYQLRYILNGSDDSSCITEKLIKKYLPQYQNDRNALLRTHKFELIELLKKHNLANLKQLILTKDNYQKQLNKIIDFKFPIIIKPYQFGSSSAGVCYYNDISQLNKDIFEQSHFISAKKFDKYILQEFLHGDEYVIDSVSLKSEHTITAIFKYDKAINSAGEKYFCGASIIDPKDPICQKITTYLIKIFTTLGINNGINHTEIIIGENQYTNLIEINPRLSGGSGSLLLMSRIYKGYSVDQYSVFFAKLGVKTFKQELQEYSYCKSIYLYSHNFSDDEFLDLFTKLKVDFKQISFDKPQIKNFKSSNKFHSVRKIIVLADDQLKNIQEDMADLLVLENI
jgi:hypothetical protein